MHGNERQEYLEARRKKPANDSWMRKPACESNKAAAEGSSPERWSKGRTRRQPGNKERCHPRVVSNWDSSSLFTICGAGVVSSSDQSGGAPEIESAKHPGHPGTRLPHATHYTCNLGRKARPATPDCLLAFRYAMAGCDTAVRSGASATIADNVVVLCGFYGPNDATVTLSP